MSTQVTVEVDESALEMFGGDKSDFARRMYEAAVVKWYDEALITSGYGAKLLGLSRAAFLDLLLRHRVSPFQYTSEEFAAEMKRG